jgi:hypothetical protein
MPGIRVYCLDCFRGRFANSFSTSVTETEALPRKLCSLALRRYFATVFRLTLRAVAIFRSLSRPRRWLRSSKMSGGFFAFPRGWLTVAEFYLAVRDALDRTLDFFGKTCMAKTYAGRLAPVKITCESASVGSRGTKERKPKSLDTRAIRSLGYCENVAPVHQASNNGLLRRFY